MNPSNSLRCVSRALPSERTSGLDGMYTLSAPESDTIRVIFTCIGYEDARRRLVDAKGDVTLNVKMTPATYTLGGIEVTDYQKQTGAMQKIDADSYKLAPDVNGGSVESLDLHDGRRQLQQRDVVASTASAAALMTRTVSISTASRSIVRS